MLQANMRNWWSLKNVLFYLDSYRQRHFHARRQHGWCRNKLKAISWVCEDGVKWSGRGSYSEADSTRWD